ncbi:MAG: SNF2-related protein, partial [Longicatena sp.]
MNKIMNEITFLPHQIETIEKTKNFNSTAYYLDMGLGKTFVGAEKMMNLGSSVNLLICQKSKIDDWIEHFNMYYTDFPYCVEVLNLTNKEDFEKFINTAHSSEPDFIHDEWTGQTYMQENFDPCQYIGVINYDLVYRRKALLELYDFTMMLDESSIIQNEKTKRTKFILAMDYKNVILLSGTPTSGKYENLWSQCHLLGWDISQKAFNTQYINWKTIEVGGFPRKTVDKVDPYKNVERLKQKMRDHGAIFMKTEEVMELPEQTFIEVKVSRNPIYKKFRRNSVIKIDLSTLKEASKDSDTFVELIGDMTLTKKLYSRWLCGAYCQNKLDAFEDLMNSTQDRLIVFYNWNIELKALKEIAQKLDRPISEVNGSIKDLSAYENEDNSITFIQYQAGSM